MAKMLIIAKAALMATGFYILSTILIIFGRNIRLTQEHGLADYVLSYFLIFLLVILVWQLLAKGDSWAGWLVGPLRTDITPKLARLGMAVYRVTVVFCGITIVFYSIPKLIEFVITFFDPSQFEKHNLYKDFSSTFGWFFRIYLFDMLRLMLGLYLLCGATNYVRVEVKKTLKYLRCKSGESCNTLQRHNYSAGEEL